MRIFFHLVRNTESYAQKWEYVREAYDSRRRRDFRRRGRRQLQKTVFHAGLIVDG